MDPLKQAGITQREAAQIVGVSEVMVWKYLTGRATPKQGHLCRRWGTLISVLDALVKKEMLPKHGLAPSPRMTAEARKRRNAMIEKLSLLVERRLNAHSTNE